MMFALKCSLLISVMSFNHSHDILTQAGVNMHSEDTYSQGPHAIEHQVEPVTIPKKQHLLSEDDQNMRGAANKVVGQLSQMSLRAST